MSQDGTGTRTVVITGASTGIGEACALRMDKLGWRVFAGVRKPADAERLRHEASERLATLTLDVTDGAQIAAAAQQVATMVGAAGLNGLVNNAGIGVGGPLEFVPLDELRRQLEVNVVGQVAVTQAFLPLIRKAKGRIVNTGSIGGTIATPFIAPYNASKFAMEAVTDALRMELRPWGIHVSIVKPGNIKTPIWDKAQASISELDETLPPEAHALYEATLAAMRKNIEQLASSGIPPARVAGVVAHALTSRQPKTRYIVGFDAHVQRLIARAVPDRTRDGLILRFLGAPR
jgi:NAD(P)-dependent dehydrogenase (short-subunit alcohol dehydrogenase family)